MAPRPIPNPWNIYNLARSPFFQQSLESGTDSPRPLSLFVGRENELRQLRQKIHSAGPNASLQAIAGEPGVGKTTLVQELKTQLFDDGYFTTDSSVPILAGDTAEDLFGRVLSGLYDTILANRPQSGGNPAMQAAQVLVRVTRLRSGGLSIPIPGVGSLGASSGSAITAPSDLLLDGPRVMRDLAAMARGSDGHGVVLHLNNLENLSDADAAKAADVLRSLRDIMFLHNGLHYLIVGTVDAVQTAVATHAQVRNLVSIITVGPLATAEVHAMLEARYTHLRLDPATPVQAPVEARTVDALSAFFRGDLRGLLKALEDGVSVLIGLDGTPARALTLAELRPVLQRRYQAELHARPDTSRVTALSVWGDGAPTRSQTQQTLQDLWGLSQARVSKMINQLIGDGYVVALPRSGRDPIQYVLSGVSRLIFG